ncbi:MAG: hypothetical protein AAGE84_09535 [Cyanobacteria bacterium P01_G01_bin.39]
MRQRQIITGVIFTVVVSGSIANLGDIKSYAQEDNTSSISNLLDLSNKLENQYEEINTALRFRVNGSEEKLVTEENINGLIATQNKLVTNWKKFCQSSIPKSEDFPANCDNSQHPKLANIVNDSLRVLDEEIKPFFDNNKTTIISTDRYKNLKLEDNPSSPNIIAKKLQEFIKGELNRGKYKNNPKQEERIKLILAEINKESGVFYKGTQKGLKIVSNKESRNIENNLLEINEKIISQLQRTSTPQDSGFKIPHITYSISELLSLLTFIAVLCSGYYQYKSLKKSEKDNKKNTQVNYTSTQQVDLNTRQLGELGQSIKQVLAANNQALKSELRSQFYQIINNISSPPSLDNISDTEYPHNIDTRHPKNNTLDKTLKDLSPPAFLDDLVTKYNKNPKKSARNTVKVAATRESIEQRRAGLKIPLIFKQGENEGENDSFWVVLDEQTSEGNYYLVPKANLTINKRFYQTVKYIFTCRGYENKSSNDFTLIHPAEVKFLKNDEYELLKPGDLRFEEN